MTVEALATVLCLVSGIYGRPSWNETKCRERAVIVAAAAERHGIEPLLMVAIDVQECDLRDDVDAPIYKTVEGRKRLVGYDACPMGVRIVGVEHRRDYDVPALYELAAARLERWKKWCDRGHYGRKYPEHLSARHHYVAHYNQGNIDYSFQVLAIRDALRGRDVRVDSPLTPRTREIVRRYLRVFGKKDGRT